ncbi:MAG TPA: tetratricopeptide repeat protein [Candidatus Paceibacterota bacterium]|nr:tetratricopeptide repeat protein [Candidatus Paceibacterota bacterium]
MEHEAKKSSFWTFDNVALGVLSVGVILLPIFNLPWLGFSIEISKRLLIAGIAFIAFVLWLLGRLQQGQLILPRNYIVAGGFLVAATSTLSAVFSGAFWNSFSGLGFEIDTTLSLLTMAILVFLIGVYFQSRKRFLSVYIGIFVVALILFIAEFLAIFVLRVSWFGSLQPLIAPFFNNLSTSVLGKWYDFGVYAGFILLSALVMIEFFSLKNMPIFRGFIIACFVLALIVLSFINYLPVWVVVGVASLIIFVYKISFWGMDLEKDSHKFGGRVQKVFLPSFLVIIIALLFITLGGNNKLGKNISVFRDSIGVPVMEVKPSILGTWQVTKQTFSHDPILGAGPNRFSGEWVKYKPPLINQTQFWNADFRFGVGFIPSQLISTGLLGLIAWVLFFVAIIYYGIRFIFTTKQDKSTRALLILAFLGSLYLWIFTIIYVPDNGLLGLAFLVTGMFVAILTDTKIIKNAEVSLTEDPRLSFASILLFVILIIGSIVVGYLVAQKYVSVYAYQKGQNIIALEGDLEKARGQINWANSLSRQDLYYRNLSELDVALAGRLLSDNTLPKEELRLRFLSQSDLAIKDAQTATQLNPLNYLNWLALGRVYQALVPLGIEGSYERSQEAFSKAKELNPTNPSILLDYFASLEINKKNISKAKDYVNQSLAVKSNYPQAVLLLSQIDVQEGNSDVAARRLEEFLSVYPQYADASLYFQLGYLKYKNDLYDQAILALGRAVSLVPNFANAKYFLGLSLREIGDKKGALQQFEDISLFNPDNEEIKQLITDLKEGRAPVEEKEETATSTER